MSNQGTVTTGVGGGSGLTPVEDSGLLGPKAKSGPETSKPAPNTTKSHKDKSSRAETPGNRGKKKRKDSKSNSKEKSAKSSEKEEVKEAKPPEKEEENQEDDADIEKLTSPTGNGQTGVDTSESERSGKPDSPRPSASVVLIEKEPTGQSDQNAPALIKSGNTVEQKTQEEIVTEAENSQQKQNQQIGVETETPQKEQNYQRGYTSDNNAKILVVKPVQPLEENMDARVDEQGEVILEDVEEELGLGARRVDMFHVKGLKDPARARMLQDGSVAVVDQEAGRVHVYGQDGGELRDFRYLLQYDFQGGVSVGKDNQILVALRNSKYSSISFYKPDGKFKFSAFLDKDSQIPAICVNTFGEIVALDTHDSSINVINREKRVHKSLRLPRESGDLYDVMPTSVTTNSENDYIILDEANLCVRIYDYKCRFQTRVYHRQDPADSFEKPQIVSANTSDCFYMLDFESLHRVDLFSPDGDYLGCPLVIKKGVIADIEAIGVDQLQVLVARNDNVSVRRYKINIPRKHRKARQKDRHGHQNKSTTTASCCCSIS